ncbi:hypothetical protein LSTR_LSTR014593, partial [Laodelphax striatellus]
VNGNGKEESKSNSSPLSSTKRVQRSGKRRQGNTYIDMIWTKWQHYMKLFAHWLLNLVWDVMALSTRLLVHLCQVSLDYSAATMRCGWRRVGDMLGRGGNRLGGGLGGRGAKSTSTPGDASSTRSWWKFWRRRSPAGEGGGSPGKQARADKQPPHEGLANNMALPTTGDDAIKRLLSCKGKDPYSGPLTLSASDVSCLHGTEAGRKYDGSLLTCYAPVRLPQLVQPRSVCGRVLHLLMQPRQQIVQRCVTACSNLMRSATHWCDDAHMSSGLCVVMSGVMNEI